jgi:hypothetical protein
VLVTSNAHAWRGVATPVQIPVWPKETGADYLIARTGRDAERTSAEALSQVLGGLPLAHEQAAAYCERLDISLGGYLKRFEAAPTQLIVHAALLAPHPIPLFLFAEPHEKFGDPLGAALAGDGVDEVVAALRAFALVDRETIVDERDASVTTDTIRLHRLVREVAALRQKCVDYSRHTLVEALAAVYPDKAYQDPASWPRCALLAPHLLSICETEMTNPAADVQQAELLVRVGDYFHGRAAYSQARPRRDCARDLREGARPRASRNGRSPQ